MSERLDHMMGRLAAAPPEVSLDGFEDEVVRGVARWRADARIAAALAPIRLGSVGLALAIGMAAGGATATASIANVSTAHLFTLAMDLAPSTLLEGAR